MRSRFIFRQLILSEIEFCQNIVLVLPKLEMRKILASLKKISVRSVVNCKVTEK